MKSGLTIHKEIQKAEYAKSPLGQLEKKLGKFYQDLLLKREKLPEDIAKKVYDIRDAHEKAQTQYIEDSQRRDREAVDAMLFDAMNKEWNLLEQYQSTTMTP